jgi:hypothetical protein
VRSTLAKALDDAAALLGGTVDAYIADATDADDAGAGSRFSISRVPLGFSGERMADGGDAGLVSAHAELHALEARLSRSLERYATLLAQATEEKRVRLGEPLSVRRFTAAGAAVRSVFTGAVSLLHGMEAGLHLCALCGAHAPAIRVARAQLADAFAAAGRLAIGSGTPEEACAAVTALEAAVEALAADVTTEGAWRKLLGHLAGGNSRPLGGSSPVRERRDDDGTLAKLRHNVQALGAVCFALGDAARQIRLIIGEIDPDAGSRSHKHGRSHSESDLLSAPGGAVSAKGGGSMGAALRGAAHALDGALHWHLKQKHERGGEGDEDEDGYCDAAEQQHAAKQHGGGKLARSASALSDFFSGTFAQRTASTPALQTLAQPQPPAAGMQHRGAASGAAVLR